VKNGTKKTQKISDVRTCAPLGPPLQRGQGQKGSNEHRDELSQAISKPVCTLFFIALLFFLRLWIISLKAQH